jgi:hypothetical protein
VIVLIVFVCIMCFIVPVLQRVNNYIEKILLLISRIYDSESF